MSARRDRAFTLIEIMISIAILAILMAVPVSMNNRWQWLSRESDYRTALRNARWTLEALQDVPFDQLPPRTDHGRLQTEYFAPDRGEAHTVPASGVVTLASGPAESVRGVFLARGDRLLPIVDWQLEGMSLRLPASTIGRVVRIDYVGSKTRTRVSGQFVDESLQPIDGPGPFKLLTVEESYGGTGKLKLTLLRAAP